MDYLTSLFCQIDDFCKEFEPQFQQTLLPKPNGRNRKCCISTAEIITVWIYFHFIRMRDFKSYYLWYITTLHKDAFPTMPSYNRFVELARRALPAMLAFLTTQMGECTGIGVVDSTPLHVCHNRRIHSHKVFKDVAQRGKSSMGWFYGFKLHAVFNHLGELVSFFLSAGNMDDRKGLQQMAGKLFGTLVGDRGYIGKKLGQWLKEQYGITLLTKNKKGMKPQDYSSEQKYLLKRRGVVETIFDQLKNLCQIEHTRHRSEHGFLLNLISGLTAYCLFPHKPQMFGREGLIGG
jgi:transposase DDE domain